MSNFIQEVTYGSDVIDKVKEPEYKVDFYINISLISSVKPTKHNDVLSVKVGLEDRYIFKSDIQKYLPENNL